MQEKAVVQIKLILLNRISCMDFYIEQTISLEQESAFENACNILLKTTNLIFVWCFHGH